MPDLSIVLDDPMIWIQLDSSVPFFDKRIGLDNWDLANYGVWQDNLIEITLSGKVVDFDDSNFIEKELISGTLMLKNAEDGTETVVGPINIPYAFSGEVWFDGTEGTVFSKKRHKIGSNTSDGKIQFKIHEDVYNDCFIMGALEYAMNEWTYQTGVQFDYEVTDVDTIFFENGISEIGFSSKFIYSLIDGCSYAGVIPFGEVCDNNPLVYEINERDILLADDFKDLFLLCSNIDNTKVITDILMHELGHVLGLAHTIKSDPSDEEDILTFGFLDEKINLELSEDDIEGATLMLGYNNDCEPNLNILSSGAREIFQRPHLAAGTDNLNYIEDVNYTRNAILEYDGLFDSWNRYYSNYYFINQNSLNSQCGLISLEQGDNTDNLLTIQTSVHAEDIYIMVGIDLNQDNIFSSFETFGEDYANTAYTYNGNTTFLRISIPETLNPVLNSETIMRIAVQESSWGNITLNSIFAEGEVEDYPVKIIDKGDDNNCNRLVSSKNTPFTKSTLKELSLISAQLDCRLAKFKQELIPFILHDVPHLVYTKKGNTTFEKEWDTFLHTWEDLFHTFRYQSHQTAKIQNRHILALNRMMKIIQNETENKALKEMIAELRHHNNLLKGKTVEEAIYFLDQLDCATQMNQKTVPIIVSEHSGMDVFQLYPNPVSNGQCYLRYIHKPTVQSKEDKVTIMLYNIEGKLIQTIIKPVEAGENLYEMNLMHLPQGNYLVKIVGATVGAKKLSIIK